MQAISRMSSEDHHHDDDGNGAEDNVLAVEDVLPIVDSILEQDDRVRRGGRASENKY